MKTPAPFLVYVGEQVKTDAFDNDDKTWVILRVARFAVSACVADVSFPFPSAKQAMKQASERAAKRVGEAGLSSLLYGQFLERKLCYETYDRQPMLCDASTFRFFGLFTMLKHRAKIAKFSHEIIEGM